MTLLRNSLHVAWLALVVLCGVATCLSQMSGHGAAIAILVIGAIKARIILLRYLGLACVPSWRAGFDLALGLLLLLLMGLFLAG